ncbi:MAG: pentapeptide repeat-containing protein [Cyanobacteria bacterium P01_A01_bin.17]
MPLPPESSLPEPEETSGPLKEQASFNRRRSASDRSSTSQKPEPLRFWAETSSAIDVNLQNLTPQQLSLLTVITVVLIFLGLFLQSALIGLPAAAIALFLSLRMVWTPLQQIVRTSFPNPYRQWAIATAVGFIALLGIAYFTGLIGLILSLGRRINWEAFGALAEAFGAIGQILVAFLALFVAWRQYIISKELTSQQNRITQQQTIDAYFQGISDLVLDEDGLLEDWPSERAIAEGRTAAILGGLSAEGRAKILRFLSSAKLLTPLKRDRRLGRAIFDGLGGYEEDIEYGVRVIDLGSMLAHSDLAATDLHQTELSDANLVGADLQGCDLSRANLSRCILYGANLKHADFGRTKLYYGTAETATPRDRINAPNYAKGTQTGAIIENIDLTQARNLSPEQRYYCCAWGGSKTRATVPGGCEGIPNKLED